MDIEKRISDAIMNTTYFEEPVASKTASKISSAYNQNPKETISRIKTEVEELNSLAALFGRTGYPGLQKTNYTLSHMYEEIINIMKEYQEE